MQGTLDKMIAKLGSVVNYTLPVGAQRLALNPLIGKPLKLSYTGAIFCAACGRKTKKSYAQGHCFPCMQKLARCDLCIMKPETCHYHLSTCREPEWGETHCMIPHLVYLANTSGLKVGITRHNQIPTRWIDQGATQALPLLRVASRRLSGLIELELAKRLADKTNWRKMLKGTAEALDLDAQAAIALTELAPHLDRLAQQFGPAAIERLEADVVTIAYPVQQYPDKISSHNFDKNPQVEGVLTGIKGQYLLFDNGVINVRKFTSYEVVVEAALN